MSPRLTLKIVISTLPAIFLAMVAGSYFSDENRAHRAYMNMRASGAMDLELIDRFINTTTPGPEYYEALNLAATLDDDYLDKVTTLYARAQILLRRKPADRIVSLLPSESLKVNTAAGRIMMTSEFGHEDPQRARQLLEYSALRGDRDAAGYLSKLYSRFDCPVGAATWARIANEREEISVCARMPETADGFTDEQRSHLAHNRVSLSKARTRDEVPVLKYSKDCAFFGGEN